MPSASKRTELRKLKMITGLKTFSSKLPCEAAMPMAVSLPITWTAIIVNDSLCVGFTFPGMIDEPGSFSGIRQLAETAPRAGCQPANIVGNLHAGRSQTLERAAREDELVVRRECRKFVGRGEERQVGQRSNMRRRAITKLRMRVQTRAHGGPADRQSGTDLSTNLRYV